MLRLFLALLLTDETRAALGRLIDRVATVGDGVKWVAAENLHVTIKFLGEQPEERVPELCAALRAAAVQVAPFSFSVGGLGGFPDLHRPRVLWAGVGVGAREMKILWRHVDQAMARLNVAFDRQDFNAHVTIGRPKGYERGARARRGGHGPGPAPISGRIAKEFAAREGESFGGGEARDLCLMRSELGPQGPTYSVVERIALGPAAPA